MSEKANTLTAGETACRELAAALGAKLREVRTGRGMSLEDTARKLGTGRAHLSAMEHALPYTSMEGQIRTLLALGVTRSELARAILCGDESAEANPEV